MCTPNSVARMFLVPCFHINPFSIASGDKLLCIVTILAVNHLGNHLFALAKCWMTQCI